MTITYTITLDETNNSTREVRGNILLSELAKESTLYLGLFTPIMNEKPFARIKLDYQSTDFCFDDVLNGRYYLQCFTEEWGWFSVTVHKLYRPTDVAIGRDVDLTVEKVITNGVTRLTVTIPPSVSVQENDLICVLDAMTFKKCYMSVKLKEHQQNAQFVLPRNFNENKAVVVFQWDETPNQVRSFAYIDF
ncbi:hypothetical protein EIN_185140 [Entamoeba invadens IP1]|uniref:hypothetical protein n=1 Tax=Entamoeba invadens IP1 TaxID=370355 RepID=UPI0002C3E6E0|nr:hypothetical protein EIN_185140 [Entamoeba invadens IP1]ELP94137.1 hypothetical protein EIN_185140 [Entamoeba invadens IP1]|eukprot:XP_004260908.1 hypothetical protein EIN_185140 [Entamoeba invadens IP1]